MKRDPFEVIGILEPVTRTRKALLGFEFSRGCWNAVPQRVFRPLGLMIWGAPSTALVRAVMIGANLQAVASCDPIPVRFFMLAQSFEQVRRLLAEDIQPPGWPDFDTMPLGYTARIEITAYDGVALTLQQAEAIQLVMWGLTVE